MKEVITLQFGEQANYVGAHYWNLMHAAAADAAAGGAHPQDALAMDTLFCTDSRQTYAPRVLTFDQPGSHTQPDPVSGEVEESDAQWNGRDVEVHRQAQRTAKQPPSSGSGSGEGEGAFRSWTDVVERRYPAQSFAAVSGVDFGNSLGQLSTFSEGRSVFEGMDARDDLLEGAFRRYAEACDRIQGFQTIADASGGFAGFGLAFLERLREEYPKSPLVLYNARAEEGRGLSGLGLAARVDVAVALAAALEAGVSMSVPLFAPQSVATGGGSGGVYRGSAFLAANVAQWGWGVVAGGVGLDELVDRATGQGLFRVAETLLAPGLDASGSTGLAELLGSGGGGGGSFTACSEAKIESLEMLAGRLFVDRGTDVGRLVRQTMPPAAAVRFEAPVPLPRTFPPIFAQHVIPKRIGGVDCVGVAGLLCSTSGSMGYLQTLHGSLAAEHSKYLKDYEREAVREFRYSLDTAIDRYSMIG
ncbi:mtDNA inheritance, partitioning of the mitochondrial organelle [Coemansia erecta]|uniref:MtDNA inheritance, partitioning of the mitochondrial organelle n=1 Tax=Coemansia erecta TaxID=147472 RepID=A0A9W7Y7S1_9FUNG|nr:mtDNA inheritance, partitioning of the mitochondrial organelle [Coemansia erecta]